MMPNGFFVISTKYTQNCLFCLIVMHLFIYLFLLLIRIVNDAVRLGWLSKLGGIFPLARPYAIFWI